MLHKWFGDKMKQDMRVDEVKLGERKNTQSSSRPYTRRARPIGHRMGTLSDTSSVNWKADRKEHVGADRRVRVGTSVAV
jgi:hypothetical protein